LKVNVARGHTFTGGVPTRADALEPAEKEGEIGWRGGFLISGEGRLDSAFAFG
jgi:hypothetical protein